jgi:transposase
LAAKSHASSGPSQIRSDQQKGFHVLPRQWVVERTFGWMMRWRRLVRDHEKRIDVSTAVIHIAMGSLLIRRNAHPRLSKRTLRAVADLTESNRPL